MKAIFGLPAVLIGAGVFVTQSHIAFAQTDVAQIRQVAQSTTVFIQSLNRPDVFGSGVILEKSGRTYTILTAKHVVALLDDYIVTVGGEKYAVKRESVKQLAQADLAILQFETDRPLTVVKIAQTSASELDRIFVAGFPKPTASVPTVEFTIVPGDVNTVIPAAQAQDGYGLRYSARTRVGMSGGPVLNSQAQLVAIHGQADELGGLAIPLRTFQSAVLALIQTSQQAQQSQQTQQRQAQAEQQRQAQAEQQRQAQAEQQRQAQAEQQRQAQAEQQTPNQQIALLAKIEPFTAPQSAQQASTSSSQEVCEWVSFGGTRVKRCTPVAATSNPQPSQSFETFLKLGNEQAARGRFDQSIVEYTKAIESKPDYAYAYFNRGLSFAKLGQSDKALTDFNKAEEMFKQQGKQSELARVQNAIEIVNKSRGLS